MGLTKGTNCGFCSSAPAADPATGAEFSMDNYSRAVLDVSPADSDLTITEIGWWASNATAEANFEVGIYTDDSGADALVSKDDTNAKGTTSGWKPVTGLNISISSSTNYWIAVQCDTSTNSACDTEALSGGSYEFKGISPTLTDPFAGNSGSANNYMAIYAVYSSGSAGGTGQFINVDDAFRELQEVYANVDDALRQINETWINKDDTWRKLF